MVPSRGKGFEVGKITSFCLVMFFRGWEKKWSIRKILVSLGVLIMEILVEVMRFGREILVYGGRY